MSCEAGPNKISRLAGQLGVGISQLAGKRGFYAGLTLGSAGLIGAGLVALARRRTHRAGLSQVQPGRQRSRQIVKVSQLPHLESRQKVEPLKAVRPTERCAGCRSTPDRRPGLWYRLDGQRYCAECAPQAANRAGVDLVKPAAQTGGEKSTVDKSRPVSISSRSRAQPLSPERRQQTRLLASRVGVYADEGTRGPNWYAVENGYVVLRPDGTDTGLAVTPALKLGPQGGSRKIPGAGRSST